MPANSRFEDFDANASDPEDGDFEISAASPRRSKKSRRNTKSSRPAASRPTTLKRKRKSGYAGASDSDIVDDEDDDISQSDFTQDSEEELEINQTTGRSVRSATKKHIHYEESDEEEEKNFVSDTGESSQNDDDGGGGGDEPAKAVRQADESEDEEEPKKARSTRQNTGKSPSRPTSSASHRILRLKFNSWNSIKSNTSRTSPSTMPQLRRREPRSRAQSHAPVNAYAYATRKSSRLSKEPESRLQELSASGRHAVPVTAAAPGPSPSSEDDAPLGARRNQGVKGPATGKQPLKAPSTVIEEPQVETQDAANEDDDDQNVVTSVEMDANAPNPDENTHEDVDEEDDDADEDEDEEDDGPVVRGVTKKNKTAAAERPVSTSKRKRAQDEGSEFDPDDDADEDYPSAKRPRQYSSKSSQKSIRKAKASQRSHSSSEDSNIDDDELENEMHELKPKDSRRQSRRLVRSNKFRIDDLQFGEDGPSSQRGARNVPRKDYTIPRMEDILRADEEALQAATTELAKVRAKPKKPTAKKPGGNMLHTITGPFGGNASSGQALLEEDYRLVVLEEPESDEDGEAAASQQLKTPARHEKGGGPAAFGKIDTSKKAATSNADPLGIDESVKFDGVGGLDNHIDRLKEMVVHPLLYPEMLQKFGVTPPRGVLFHGPPGTGKTLVARALSNSIDAGGKQVTFFMRKGADALSKWVGEAERGLRLLFEEAKKCQPSIIFFDEIDGLAPVRSSKSEQIHASIVATLLALMDGMDNRGQVVIIGATNRPDNVDPALRRPGRFDREFYFPLPDQPARRAIIDINTKKWEHPLDPAFKDQLAALTGGYAGADIRALCTDAAYNAIQGTYPQIYSSNKKLQVDPNKIRITAKDFMIALGNINPSSQRSSTKDLQPLHKDVEPLLREQLQAVSRLVDRVLPRRPRLTALEEAEFDDREDNNAFQRHDMLQRMDRSRVFRPRLLLRGLRGNGQIELAAALQHKLEGLYVQSFDMATLLQDGTRSPEASVVALFKELRTRKPSVIFIPDVDEFYDDSTAYNVRQVFLSQLHAIPANEPILLLGMQSMDSPDEQSNPQMMKDLFNFSSRSAYQLERPSEHARHEFFEVLMSLAQKRPSEFPDPRSRKRRKIEVLPEVQEDSTIQTARAKAHLKLQYQEDCYALNQLKVAMLPSILAIKENSKNAFAKPVIDAQNLKYLWDDDDEDTLTSDLTEERRQQLQDRPYIKDKDAHGRLGLREVETGKFFYNLDVEDVHVRALNGYYCRWKELIDDVKTFAHDAEMKDDLNRVKYAREVLTNIQIDAHTFLKEKAQLASDLEVLYSRFFKARQERMEKDKRGQDKEVIGTTTNQAPILSAPPHPASRRPVTPASSQHHSNGDGSAHMTNGSTVPSRPSGDDVQMVDVPPQPTVGTMLAPTHTHSQRSALEKMAPGSQVEDYHNSASTTSSGQNYSNRNSGNAPGLYASAHTPMGYPKSYPATYHGPATPSHVLGAAHDANAQGDIGGNSGPTNSNGTSNTNRDTHVNSNGTESRHYPNFASEYNLEGNSQPIPDTQPNSDDQNSLTARSNGAGPGPNKGTAAAQHLPGDMVNLLNPVESSAAANAAIEPVFIPATEELVAFHDMLATQTSGMSVEQILQVNAVLTNEIVEMYALEWDKRKVVTALIEVFAQTKGDIREMQKMYEASFE